MESLFEEKVISKLIKSFIQIFSLFYYFILALSVLYIVNAAIYVTLRTFVQSYPIENFKTNKGI